MVNHIEEMLLQLVNNHPNPSLAVDTATSVIIRFLEQPQSYVRQAPVVPLEHY